MKEVLQSLNKEVGVKGSMIVTRESAFAHVKPISMLEAPAATLLSMMSAIAVAAEYPSPRKASIIALALGGASLLRATMGAFTVANSQCGGQAVCAATS